MSPVPRGIGAGGATTTALRRRTTIAALLAVALLVCHGLFGASHVLAQGEAPVRAGHHASMNCCMADVSPHHAAGQSDIPEGASGGSLVGLDYFAVILTLFGGALLLKAFRGAARVPAGATYSRASIYRPRAENSILARGPSPPLLQVFRL